MSASPRSIATSARPRISANSSAVSRPRRNRAVAALLHIVLWALGTLAALYVGVVFLVFACQRVLIFVPGTRRPDVALAGLPGLVEATVETADGLDLLAWYRPADIGKPTLVYLHGNGGTIHGRIPRVQGFAVTGWGLLFLEYRGYGGNPGKPSEAGVVEDARACMRFLARQGVASTDVILYGESIGTGVATQLAATMDVAALLLESPFTSVSDLGRLRYPFLPVRWLIRDPFDLLSRIAAVRAPVLVMLGAKDLIVPPSMGRAVYDAAGPPKDFWLAPEGGHNDLIQHGITDAAIGFVKKHVSGS